MKFGRPVRTVILIRLALAAIVIVWLFDLLIFPTGFFWRRFILKGCSSGWRLSHWRWSPAWRRCLRLICGLHS